MKIEFINPITNQQDYLEITYKDIDYHKWRNYNQESQYDCINGMLQHYLHELDCTREYKSGRPMMTHYPIYQLRLADYYYWLCKITNQIQYNNCIDVLIQRHIENLIFEHEHPYIKEVPKKKISKKKVKHGWQKQETKDLFTGETIYIYQNLDTGEYINSNNPNMLEKLNKPKKRIKIPKDGISLDAMTFSFKTD